MMAWKLSLFLLLLLSGPPAVQPVPPTCYSRMLTLSREITGDFQSLQAAEPEVSPSACLPYSPGGTLCLPPLPPSGWSLCLPPCLEVTTDPSPALTFLPLDKTNKNRSL
jgi:hypothetical protein